MPLNPLGASVTTDDELLSKSVSENAEGSSNVITVPVAWTVLVKPNPHKHVATAIEILRMMALCMCDSPNVANESE